MFLMAGLWNRAPDPKTGEEIEAYTVVTTAANDVIKIHDRMPVIVDEDDVMRWLGDRRRAGGSSQTICRRAHDGLAGDR